MTEDTDREHPPGLDLERLRTYLDDNHPGFRNGSLRAELIQGGRSNLTYRLTDGEHEWVLRRPPLGHVLATAHDMGREYRVVSALADTGVPVPRTHLLCTEDQVIGAPFYVMDFVPGRTYRSAEEIGTLDRRQRRELALRMTETLARLHEIDPDSVGLSDFGRPEGFLHRQLRRWSKQLDASYSREIPGIVELRDRLAETVPENGPTAVVHGDYRLDNLLADENGEIRAVLDWEMATLGDPLTDLGLLVVYWEGLSGIRNNPVATGVGPEHGFPPARELLDHYAAHSGIDVSGLDWYVAFGFFKIAVILEGIHYRYTQGKTVGDGFEHVGDMVEPLVRQGLSNTQEI
ncbi:phosphotransferase family protein [Actinopolyspora mortivallis]|uniref:Acyl-CoA dehydrogenase n=1 Tax=Actinopolyspora mortivallis TaxID=33906 RepID=A0A2T0GRV6_ACTMO|nr:phosphotransferase family protein [Actinopolyspora mortivallis]PRW61827.1 acyl-CoA dehydrogenase [Actinopolyspora mortivallis]